MGVEIIQTDIKLYSLVVSVLRPNLKEICLCMSKSTPTLKENFFVCLLFSVVAMKSPRSGSLSSLLR